MSERAPRVRSGALSVALILAALLAGCGGGDDDRAASSTTATTAATAAPTAGATPSPAADDTLSHSELVRRLNKTCSGDEARVDQINAEFQERLGSGDYASAAASIQELIDLATPNWKQQRELDAPPEDAETFAAYMDAQRQFQGIMRRLVAAIREQDVEQINFLAAGIDDIRKARLKAAIALGADGCGG